MQKFAVLVLISFIFSSCSLRYGSVDYANPLAGCIGIDNVKILNKICFVFEEKLRIFYPEDDIEVSYNKFMSNLQENKLNPNMIKNKKIAEILVELKEHEVFNMGWMRASDYSRKFGGRRSYSTSYRIKDGEREMIDPFVVNVNGKLFTCIFQNDKKNKMLSILIGKLKYYPEEPIDELVDTLIKYGEIDYSNKLTRLAIAIGLYYNMAFDEVVFD